MEQILVVDDNPGDILLIIEALNTSQRPELSIHVLSDGSEVLPYLRERDFEVDLIFMDMATPKVSGTELLSSISAETSQGCPPIIAWSSDIEHEDPERLAHIYDAGANTIVAKPMYFLELQSVVHRVLDYWLEIALIPCVADMNTKRTLSASVKQK